MCVVMSTVFRKSVLLGPKLCNEQPILGWHVAFVANIKFSIKFLSLSHFISQVHWAVAIAVLIN